MKNDPVESNPHDSIGGPSNGPAGAPAEGALWRQFSEAANQESFAGAWLALQCRMIEGTIDGVVLLSQPDDNQPFQLLAFWPDERQLTTYSSNVATVARREARGIVVRRPAENGTGESFDIAYPIRAQNRVRAIVLLHIETRPEAQLNGVLRQLQWGSGWLEVLLQRIEQQNTPSERLAAVVEIMARVAGQERFHGAAFAFVSALGTRFGCDRVSLGFLRKGHVKVEALSHSADFGKDTNLMRAVAGAMEEAIDQQATIAYPPKTDAGFQITLNHAELTRQYRNGAICSVPLAAHGQTVGAITLERAADQPFDAESISTFAALAALAGPILKVHWRDDRWIGVKALDAGRVQVEHLIGPRHVALKLTTLAVVLLIAILAFFKTDYRVNAKTVVEPLTKRAVSAAFNGYISEAPARAGDLVRKDQVLAKLDDRDLKLERSKWSSQEQQSLKQYYEALGSRNAPQVQILTAQIDQATAQIALIDEQLSRTEVLAPFDGVVVTGDLSQSLGSPVERGQLLFEVAPLDRYRVILQVDEREIAEVKPGQRGDIAVSGFPSDPVPFTVDKVTPISTAGEGHNYFRVEARLHAIPERLRPGMEGIGKIEIDRRRLIWIWTHDITDWIRLKVWQYMP